jgi:predicted secreted hydrolase
MNRPRAPGRGSAIWLVAASVLTAVLVWHLLAGRRTPHPPAAIPLAEILDGSGAGDAAGWGQAETSRPLALPGDHGAHPQSRTEAWALTAALVAPDGRRFHLQFALYRLALGPSLQPRPSPWAARQAYRAHLAVTDVHGGHQFACERLSRDALGLAGADAAGQTLHLWLEDWSLAIDQEPADRPSLRLSATQNDLGVGLALTGDGLAIPPADLAPEAATGWHGYLMPRLTAAGTLRLAGRESEVTGNAWLNHVWGALPLAGGQLTLARFSLHLADGRDLLCLRTSRRDGGGTPIPTCTLIGTDGDRRRFERRDLTLEPRQAWASPRDGTLYPVGWRLALPDAGLDLELIPLTDAQEMDLYLRLWAGGVRVTGTASGAPATGVGHIELTGFGPREPGS